MKKILLICSIFVIAAQIITTQALAQEEMTTLFGAGEARISGYGAFEIRGSQLDNGIGLLLGGRGGVILNNTIAMGIAGYGLLPTKKINCPILEHDKEKNTYWTGGYGGLFFEYIHSSNSLVHFTANTLIGCGGVTYVSLSDNNHYNNNNYNSISHPVSVVLVLEPAVEVELNVSKIFRMALGASYRYSPTFELKYDDKNIAEKTAFNGFSINLVFKFGKF